MLGFTRSIWIGGLLNSKLAFRSEKKKGLLTLYRIWCSDQKNRCRNVHWASPWNWIVWNTRSPRQLHRVPRFDRTEHPTPGKYRYNNVQHRSRKDFRFSCKHPPDIGRSLRYRLPASRIRWSIPGTRRHAAATTLSKSFEIRWILDVQTTISRRTDGKRIYVFTWE